MIASAQVRRPSFLVPLPVCKVPKTTSFLKDMELLNYIFATIFCCCLGLLPSHSVKEVRISGYARYPTFLRVGENACMLNPPDQLHKHCIGLSRCIYCMNRIIGKTFYQQLFDHSHLCLPLPSFGFPHSERTSESA